jgi:hypothetical protein
LELGRTKEINFYMLLPGHERVSEELSDHDNALRQMKHWNRKNKSKNCCVSSITSESANNPETSIA